MKKIVIAFVLILTQKYSQATVCVDRTFQFDHLRLDLCQNYTNYNETRVLLYKARAQQLNKFINDLIRAGKLPDKFFYIEILDDVLTYDHLMVSQSPKGCFIDCSGFVSFNYLAKAINYFAQENWKSFVYDPGKASGFARTKIEKIIDSYSLPDLSTYTSEAVALWNEGGVYLTYTNDQMNYSVGSFIFNYKPSANLPIKINQRYLFFQEDGVFVVQDVQQIAEFKFPEKEDGDYKVNKYAKWVNIGGYNEDAFYSYSYDENKFYDLRKNKAKQ